VRYNSCFATKKNTFQLKQKLYTTIVSFEKFDLADMSVFKISFDSMIALLSHSYKINI